MEANTMFRFRLKKLSDPSRLRAFAVKIFVCHHKLPFLIFVMGILLAGLPAGAQAFSIATTFINIPYNQDFESGLLPAEWQAQTSGQGRVRILPAHFPGVGIYSVVLDDSTAGGSPSTAAALLSLNLKRESQVTLSFWYKAYNEETASGDGVFISADGSTWARIFTFDPLASEWTNVMIDLDMESLAYGARAI